MKPDRSQWRHDVAYTYMDELPVGDLAWECLRRNGHYQKDFARYVRAKAARSTIEDVIADRWGLRFRCAPEPHGCRAACPLDAERRSCGHPADRAA